MIDCPECSGNVGIPAIPYLSGVESDSDKQLTSSLSKNSWICESCDYQHGPVPGQALNASVTETHARRKQP